MELQTEKRGNALVVSIQERRVDAAIAIQFKDSVRAAIAAPSDRVVMDLSRVDFLDSSGLGAVVAALKMMGPGRTLELAGLTPTVAKVFRLTRMDGVFTIHQDLECALADGPQTV